MKKRDKKGEFDALKSELKKYKKQGVALTLEGKPSNPYDIAKACRVSERAASYMRDYISDEDGNLREINFQLVSHHLDG